MPEPQRATGEADDVARLRQLIEATRVAQVIYVVAELGLPDLLQDGPRSVEDLARATHTHEPSLCRLMRALAALGVVMFAPDGQIALTSLGNALRSETHHQVHLQARVQLGEPCWRPWGQLIDSVRTGESAFQHMFGMSKWEYDASHPQFSALFNGWMSAISQHHQEAILAAYDFSHFGTLVDVGGGHGQLLQAILRVTPRLRGVLFDQPHVVQGAMELLSGAGLTGRYRTAGGNFFDAVTPGADAYILKFIIHDWDDEHALAILRNVHEAMAPGGTILLIEQILSEDGSLEISEAIADLNMLVMLQGKERTQTEFQALIEAAGFLRMRLVATDSGVRIIEGKRDRT
jgi:hypothetical protein